MREDDAGAVPVERRAERALAAARAAGTSEAAVDAVFGLLGWKAELSARELSTDEHAQLRNQIAATSQALLDLGLSRLRSSPLGAVEVLAAVHEACGGIDVIVFASEALDEAKPWAVPWLARVEQLAPVLLMGVAQGELSLVEVIAGGHPLIHTCKMAAERLPELAARFEALWARWVDATAAHPTVRQALALRELVRERGWRFPEVVSQACALAERNGAPAAAILEWILGSAPFPFGRSDDSENRNGRNGYAHSAADAVGAALAVMDLGPDDIFYDLGSGVGLPCVVAALSSEAACRGVEFHAAYVERARENARQLGLARVEFFVGDVATFDWTDGNKFYMFNPFPDDVLRIVTARLLRLASHKPIRIACFHNMLPDGFRRIGGEGKLSVYEANAETVRHAGPAR